MSRPVEIKFINSATYQLDNITSTTLKKLKDKFSFTPPGYKFNPKFRLMGLSSVKVSMIRPDRTFPQGLVFDIIEELEKLGKEVIVDDKIIEKYSSLLKYIKVDKDLFSHIEYNGKPVELRDYQVKAIKKAFKYRNGILNLSTGAGKCLGADMKIKVKIDDK
jgi:hypothetical protein